MTKKFAPKNIRDGFGEGLMALGKNPKVLALSADLAESVRMEEFSRSFPQRFLQMGIAEQNMAAVAAGLALSGYIPFIGSFASFQPYRNLDQIRTSICMQDANVKIVGSHAGFSHPSDGIQIQALEDIAIMQTLPNMTVLVPADFEQAKLLTVAAAEISGPVYLRLGRSPSTALNSFSGVIESTAVVKVGKSQLLRAGTDVALITYGYMVSQCMRAAEVLEQQGIYASVVNMHTIKPVDMERVLELSEVVRAVVVVEEHQVAGGLGWSVAAILAQEGSKCRFGQVAVDDAFGDTAETAEQLWELHGLTSASIVAKVVSLFR